MDIQQLKRIALALLAVVIACFLISIFFKLIVFLFAAAAILVLAAFIYGFITVKLRKRNRGKTSDTTGSSL